MNTLFITGTDTGIGKTHIATRLAAIWHQEGKQIGVFKPVESDCSNGRPADAEALLAAAQSGQSLEEVCPYRFKAPLAPAVAADREGISVDFIDIHARLTKMKYRFEIVLIEGAGGILVPLTENATYLDLVLAADLPVLVVVGNKLGCINHALLTERALLSSGARVAGILLNDFLGTETPATLSNQEVIEQMAYSHVLGTWPYRPDTGFDDVSEQERELAASVLSAVQLANSV